MKIVVGCDADGILTNLSEFNLKEGAKVYKEELINPAAYDMRDMYANLKPVKLVPKAVVTAKAFGIFKRYCTKEPPREGVVETIKDLSNDSFEFHSITARKFATNKVLGKISRKWFTNWLKKYSINFSSIQFCDESSKENKTAIEKLLACKKLGVDVMIEDKPDVALYLAKNGVKVIMVNAPYNLETVHENIIHVDNWYQVREKLEEIKRIKQEQTNVEFIKQERDVLETYSDEQKKIYFSSYQKYLKNLTVNKEAFKKGDKKFKLIYGMLKYPIKAFYRVKTFGKENIPYQNGFIMAANHTDSTDQYRLGLALGNRPFVGFAAKEIENSFRGSLFKSTGLGIFVDRKDSVSRKESSDLMANYVAHDRIALIFPEGTRKNKDEEGRNKFQNRFKLGTVSIAQKTGTAILPVAVNAFGHYTVVRFGELFFVNPTDDLVEVNRNLEMLIANMSLENIEYYCMKKGKLDMLQQEKEKYNKYIQEIQSEFQTQLEQKKL